MQDQHLHTMDHHQNGDGHEDQAPAHGDHASHNHGGQSGHEGHADHRAGQGAHAGHAAAHDGHTGHDQDEHGHESHADHQAGQGAHAGHAAAHDGHTGHEQGGHGAHVDHTGHEQMFRRRFWVCLLLTIPVLLFSPMLQEWLGFSMPEFPGSRWIGPLFAVAIFCYGGLPFLQMAVPEIRNRKPGMMTLISLAIAVAFVYSVFALFFDPEDGFFWEMTPLP